MKFSKKALTLLLGATFAYSAQAENVVRWAAQTDIATLDPYAFASTSALSFQNNIYEALIQWNDKLQMEGVLATDWEFINDTTLRLSLRQDVKFHNGNRFNADDVVASIARVTHQDSGVRGNVSTIKEAKKIDEYTVEIILNNKSSISLNELTSVLMMDEEWLKEHNALQPTNMSQGTEGYATNNTNGTGPFKLVSRRRDAEMVLEKNTEWWNTANAEHNIDKIIFSPVKSPATRLAGLMAGEFDLVSDVPLQDLPRIEKNPDLKVLVTPSLRVDYLSLNMSDTLIAGNVNGANPLQDLRVRQAMFMAINRDAIVKKIMRNMTTVANHYVAPAIAGYDEKSAITLSYNPQQAKKLLAEAGYPDGFKLAFDCVQGAYLNAEQWCQAVQTFWSKVGIKSDFNIHPRSTYSQVRDNHKTDVAVIGWANLPLIDAHSINVQLLHSKDNNNYGAFNIPQYKNTKVDRLIEESALELDHGKRVQLMAAALNQSQLDLPYIPLHHEPVAWVLSKHFELPQAPDNVPRLWYGNFK
ncbi:ABC transporter substrate-binding protein [Photobacterium sp.]|uniref:ABC transporter substrate-binding protein n=1 Tax=Photobacterium sp. TaxID=660 RepID=UPI00299E6A8F|nr:ABC transporter substrate-binding protein [Photobacterium sp.]MDX1301037.1 ABC transporter substrate-binding protein [Photobacterium sp.]